MAPTSRNTNVAYCNVNLERTAIARQTMPAERTRMPQPPVPRRFRRRMLALGSGDPTRAICSTLIAEAYQSIRYPVLPMIETLQESGTAREILHIKHYSLFAPRDFDVSPYFQVVKPTIEYGFDYKALQWAGPAPTGRNPIVEGVAPDA